MTIASLDDYIVSNKWIFNYYKHNGRTTQGQNYGNVFDQTGNPEAGSMTLSCKTTGQVPVNTTNGYIHLPAFNGTPYISKVQYGSAAYPVQITIYDKLFECGTYAQNDNVTLGSQPSFQSRIPGGSYIGTTELWLEQVTNANTTSYWQIEYLDQDGNAGDTGSQGFGTPYAGQQYRFSLAAGDSGISRINRVQYWNSTGTGNIQILRPLVRMNCTYDMTPAFQYSHGQTRFRIDDLLKTGLIQITKDACLVSMQMSIAPQYTANIGYAQWNLEIAEK